MHAPEAIAHVKGAQHSPALLVDTCCVIANDDFADAQE